MNGNNEKMLFFFITLSSLPAALIDELHCEHGDSSLGISLPQNRYLDGSLLGNW